MRNEKTHKVLFMNALNALGTTELSDRVAFWSERLKSIIEETIVETEALFKMTLDSHSNICLTIGNNTTNAIVTHLDGQTIFFFAEKLNPEYEKVLVSHELIHTVHRKNYSSTNEIYLIDMLFMEGIACYYSKRLNPGLNNAEYLSFKAIGNNQVRNGFIQSEAKAIYDDFYNESGEIFSKYLSSEHPYGIQYARIGYDIGLIVTEKFAEKMSDQEIFNLGLEDSRALFEETFKAIFLVNTNV